MSNKGDNFNSKIDRIKSTIKEIQLDIDNIKQDCYHDDEDVNNTYINTSMLLSNLNSNTNQMINYNNEINENLNSTDNTNTFVKHLNYNYSDANLINQIGEVNDNVYLNNKLNDNRKNPNYNNGNATLLQNKSARNLFQHPSVNTNLEKNEIKHQFNKLIPHSNRNNYKSEIKYKAKYNIHSYHIDNHMNNNSKNINNINMNINDNTHNAGIDSNNNDINYNKRNSHCKYNVYNDYNNNNYSKLTKHPVLNQNNSKNIVNSIHTKYPQKTFDDNNLDKMNYLEKNYLNKNNNINISNNHNLNLSNYDEDLSEMESLRDKILLLEKKNNKLHQIISSRQLEKPEKSNNYSYCNKNSIANKNKINKDENIDVYDNNNLQYQYNTTNTITTSYLRGDNKIKNVTKKPNKTGSNTRNKSFTPASRVKDDMNDNMKINDMNYYDNDAHYTTITNNYKEIILDTKTVEKNVSILIEIQKILNVDNFDEIIPYLKKSKLKLKDNFITKVSGLHEKIVPKEIINYRVQQVQHDNIDNKDKDRFKKKYSKETSNLHSNLNNLNKEPDIKDLWSWIKSLVRYQESISNNNNNGSNLEYDTINTNRNIANIKEVKKAEYEELCEKIIKENSLRNTKELKVFLDKAVLSLHSSRKKVDKIKELLFRDPHSRDHSKGQFNKSNNTNTKAYLN